MLTLDIDIIGILVFLWAIISGLKSSQDAKKKKAERERNRPKSAKKARPQVFEQPTMEKKRGSRPETPKETIPMPDWFPFPVEIPIPKEAVKETKPKVTPVKPVFREEKASPPFPEQTEVRKKVLPTVIESQERQWKAREGYGLNLDAKAVVNGIIWSEVLGPPRAKKKFHYR